MIDYDPIALMEENIMHSMSQQHFPPRTADSRESSQTFCRIPLTRWEPGLHPPIPACASPWDGPVLVWLAYGTIQSSFEVRKHNSRCSKSTWELMQKKKLKSVTEVHSASACSVVGSFKMRSLTELATGGCCLIQMAHLSSFSKQDSFCKTVCSCKIETCSHQIKGYWKQIWKLLIHVCTLHSVIAKSTTKIPALLG